MADSDGNGNPRPGATSGASLLGIINSGAIALLIALMAGFWSLADPRGEIRSIRDGYLSIREHNEFRERVRQDIDRIESEMRTHNVTMMTRSEFEIWKLARGNLITERELLAHIDKDKAVVESLRREIDQLDKSMNARFGPIVRDIK